MTDTPNPAPGINIIFDGPPGQEAPRFIEIENDQGRSIRLGEWMPDPRAEHEGYWRIRITLADVLAHLGDCTPISDGTAFVVTPREG